MATLGEQAVGNTVKINVNGTPRNFIVVNQGLPSSAYDSSCDGTWLLMEDIYEARAWNGANTNDYANSAVHSYLNNTFVNLFDNDIKGVIRQVKLPYTKGTGKGGSVATGSNGLSAQIFLLSYTEMGFSGGNVNVEGAALDYFNGAADSKRIAKLSGSAQNWSLRSPYTNNTYYILNVTASGSTSNSFANSSHGVRPALVLPSDLSVNGSGEVVLKKQDVGCVNIGGSLKPLTGKGYIKKGGILCPITTSSKVNIANVLKSLLIGEEATTSRLPDGYTEVEYIQSSGTQYIDTGFIPNQDTRIDISAMAFSAESAGNGTGFIPYGSGVSYTSNAFECYAADGQLEFNYANSYAFVCEAVTNSIYNISHNENVITVTGAASATYTFLYAGISPPYTMTLFAIHRASVIVSGAMRLYSCKIYNKGVPVRDFVPCTNPSGEAGLYDLEDGKFYGNNGTGSFTAGAAV